MPRPRVRSAACCRHQGSSVPESHSLWQGTGGTRPKRRLAGCQSASSDWQCDTGIQRASDFLCKGSGRDFPEAAPAPCTVMPPVATQRAPDSKCMYIVILRLAVAHGAQDIPNGSQGHTHSSLAQPLVHTAMSPVHCALRTPCLAGGGVGKRAVLTAALMALTWGSSAGSAFPADPQKPPCFNWSQSFGPLLCEASSHEVSSLFSTMESFSWIDPSMRTLQNTTR